MNHSTASVQQLGRYHVQNLIASGGMANIYRAKLVGVEGFEKVVAIKQILPHWSSNREFIDMLIDEAKVLLRLNHANIVHVFELNKQDDIYYLVMEYVDGADLRHVLKNLSERKEVLPVDLSLHIISQVLQALQYAHSRLDSTQQSLEIVHRDISPQNILLSRDGEVKVTDFGIAKIIGKTNETVTGTLKGKFAYMSPEQALGRDIDHRTDIFAAGIVLYEMVTGQRCFKGKNDLETLEAVRAAHLDFSSQAHLPQAIKDLISRALARDVDLRFQSAEDMLLQIRQIQNDFPSSSTEVRNFLQPILTMHHISLGTEKVLRSKTKVLEPSSANASTIIVTRSDSGTMQHPETILESQPKSLSNSFSSPSTLIRAQLEKTVLEEQATVVSSQPFLPVEFSQPVEHSQKNHERNHERKWRPIYTYVLPLLVGSLVFVAYHFYTQKKSSRMADASPSIPEQVMLPQPSPLSGSSPSQATNPSSLVEDKPVIPNLGTPVVITPSSQVPNLEIQKSGLESTVKLDPPKQDISTTNLAMIDKKELSPLSPLSTAEKKSDIPTQTSSILKQKSVGDDPKKTSAENSTGKIKSNSDKNIDPAKDKQSEISTGSLDKDGKVKAGKGRVVVNVVPWGKVTVIKSNGSAVASQEAPLKRELSGGNYTVKVNFPPMDKTLSTGLYISEGALVRCSARFGEKNSLSCR